MYIMAAHLSQAREGLRLMEGSLRALRGLLVLLGGALPVQLLSQLPLLLGRLGLALCLVPLVVLLLAPAIRGMLASESSNALLALAPGRLSSSRSCRCGSAASAWHCASSCSSCSFCSLCMQTRG